MDEPLSTATEYRLEEPGPVARVVLRSATVFQFRGGWWICKLLMRLYVRLLKRSPADG